MLNVEALQAFYGKSQVLQGVDLQVRPGEVVALLGRNGAGRSTLLRAVMGQVRSEGRVSWKGQPLLGRSPWEIARAGVGHVAEGREVFPTLTVHQNLLLGQRRGAAHDPPWTVDDAYRLFPQLDARRRAPGGVLSGGEQQMLALCRALMGNPGLLLVDEPAEGLAPAAVAQVAGLLQALRQRGVAVLLVEQKLALAMDVADRCGVMGHGRIVFEGRPADLRSQPAVIQEWLAV